MSEEADMMPQMVVAGVDMGEVMKRAMKYLIEGGAVAVAAYMIPRKMMTPEEVLMIAVVAAATFAILDMYAPAVSAGARQGAGFGLGAQVVNWGA